MHIFFLKYELGGIFKKKDLYFELLNTNNSHFDFFKVLFLLKQFITI